MDQIHNRENGFDDSDSLREYLVVQNLMDWEEDNSYLLTQKGIQVLAGLSLFIPGFTTATELSITFDENFRKAVARAQH